MAEFWNDKVVPFFKTAGDAIVRFWNGKAVPFFKTVGEKTVDFWNDKAVPFFKTVGAKTVEIWNDKVVPFFKTVGAKTVDFWNDKAVPFFKDCGEKIVEFWNDKALPFIMDGNNKYYVIAGAAVLVALIVLLSVLGAKSNAKKKAAKTKKTIYDYNEVLPEEAANVVPAEEPTEDTASVYYAPEALDPTIVHPSTFDPAMLVVPEEEVVVAEEPAEEEVQNIEVVPEEEVVDEASVKEDVIDAEINASDEVAEVEQPIIVEDVVAEKEEPNGSVHIYKDSSARYRFRFIANNGNIVGHGQGYTTKLSCKNGIDAIIKFKYSPIVDITRDETYKPAIGTSAFEVYRDAERKYRFRLRASNTQTILVSQGYTSKANCMNGIRSIRKISANYEFVDETIA